MKPQERIALPFRYAPEGDCDGERYGIDHFVLDANGDELCVAPNQTTAEFVVRACNAHDELVSALETLVADVEAEYRDRNGDADHDGIEKAKTALAKAKGEPK